jgi:hypothetical protein
MAAAAVEARGRGYAAVVRESAVVGEARSAAAEWAGVVASALGAVVLGLAGLRRARR